MANLERAFLMAAGLGARMRPLTLSRPKPLVEVRGRSLVQTVIEGLLRRGVGEIYVITGHLGEQFAPLAGRFPEVRLIENPDYRTRNNISSLDAAADWIGQTDCFICEADLYVADPLVFSRPLPRSCYYARKGEGKTDDWVFDVAGGRITGIHKGGEDQPVMAGVSYFKKGDARILSSAIRDAARRPENHGLFWDEVVARHLGELRLGIEWVSASQIVEIDTVRELEAIRRSAAAGGRPCRLPPVS